MIEWVFFDVGNVLYWDTGQSWAAYRFASERLEARGVLTWPQLLAERERRIANGQQWVLKAILVDYLGDEAARGILADMQRALDDEYDSNHQVAPNAHAVLAELANHYRLGIIANQSLAARPSLARRGLLDFFDVVAISDELGLAKPDPALYAWALAQAGITGPRAVMVGDRRDNDVAPAQQLAMKTIWLRWPATTVVWQPPTSAAAEFYSSLKRYPLFSASGADVQPDATIEELQAIPAVVSQWAKLG